MTRKYKFQIKISSKCTYDRHLLQLFFSKTICHTKMHKNKEFKTCIFFFLSNNTFELTNPT